MRQVPGLFEFWFVTGIESYGHVVPGVYCCDLVDFRKAAECPFAPIFLGEGLEDCQYYRVVVFRGMLLCGIFSEEILTTLGHLPEYATCSKAMGWYGIRHCVYFAWPIEPSL